METMSALTLGLKIIFSNRSSIHMEVDVNFYKAGIPNP